MPEGILPGDASVANFDRKDTTVFGTLGSCTRALHIVGKTTYFGHARCERTSSMWMPREHEIIGELA